MKLSILSLAVAMVASAGFSYGSGGFGDMGGAYLYGHHNAAYFNLNVCEGPGSSEKNCTADYPNSGYVWRFIEHLGWRKFTHYGAAKKDWWDFKDTHLKRRNYRRYLPYY